jgi:hypothetical protein
VRERLGDPRVVPGFRCSFHPDMPPSLTPGSSIVVSVQNIDVDIGLRHGPKGSALPMIPQSVSRGARISGLLWFADCYGLSGCWPPCTDLTGLPANGGFYFQAFNGSVVLPAAGYDYNSDWTPLLAGLSPAGMAASLAALARPGPSRRILAITSSLCLILFAPCGQRVRAGSRILRPQSHIVRHEISR